MEILFCKESNKNVNVNYSGCGGGGSDKGGVTELPIVGWGFEY